MAKRDGQSPLLFVLSIDTEEEWDWRGPFPDEVGNVANVEQIPAFQQLCEQLGIRPTYLVDYAVADDADCVAILRDPLARQACEIGAHLHPWVNPPFYGKTGEAESHVINLPLEQVEAKLDALVKKLTFEFGQSPKSFRTGRWGINGDVLKLLANKGFTVDSSVYPFYENEFFSCHGAPELPYWPDYTAPLTSGSQRDIFELPVTAGFSRGDFQTSNKVHQFLAQPALSWLHPVGLAWHTHILRKIYLSPELDTAADMLTLCSQAIAKGHPVLHMYLHSSSLIDNTNSLVGNLSAYRHITESIREVVTKLQQSHDLTFCTLSEACSLLQSRKA